MTTHQKATECKYCNQEFLGHVRCRLCTIPIHEKGEYPKATGQRIYGTQICTDCRQAYINQYGEFSPRAMKMRKRVSSALDQVYNAMEFIKKGDRWGIGKEKFILARQNLEKLYEERDKMFDLPKI